MDDELGNVFLGNRVIATDVSFEEYLEHYAGQPIEWIGQWQPQSPVLPSDRVIATNVGYDEFLQQFDGQHVEWIHGTVVEMSPVDERHDALTRFLGNLFQVYLELTGGGRVLSDPMVMGLGPELPARQPDLQILLPENLNRIAQNSVEGPADLVIEIISPESIRRDRIDKFLEYERGGVREYWLIDPAHEQIEFYVLTKVFDKEQLEHIDPDAAGIYTSAVLPKLRLPVAVLWQRPLPGYVETLRIVERMLGES